MSKEIAVDVLRDGIKSLKVLIAAGDQATAHADLLRGLCALMEAYAMALNDSTRSHAALAFDKAHKRLFDITQNTNRPLNSHYV